MRDQTHRRDGHTVRNNQMTDYASRATDQAVATDTRAACDRGTACNCGMCTDDDVVGDLDLVVEADVLLEHGVFDRTAIESLADGLRRDYEQHQAELAEHRRRKLLRIGVALGVAMLVAAAVVVVSGLYMGRPNAPAPSAASEPAELRATLTEQAGSLHQADAVTALAIAAKEIGASRRAA